MMELHDAATTLDLLVRGLAHEPDSLAIIHGELRLTRADLAARISTYQQVLEEAGLGVGSAFAILAPSRVDALVAQFAAQLTGARMTLLSATASTEDLSYIVSDADIGYLIIDGERFKDHAAALSALPTIKQTFYLGGGNPDLEERATGFRPSPLMRPAVTAGMISSVAYTGGTTGRPKGVTGTYRSGSALAQIQNSEWQWPVRPRTLICTPLTHAGGTFFLPTLMRGGYVVVLDHFTPQAFFAAVQEHRISATMLVPTMISALLHHEEIDHWWNVGVVGTGSPRRWYCGSG